MQSLEHILVNVERAARVLAVVEQEVLEGRADLLGHGLPHQPGQGRVGLPEQALQLLHKLGPDLLVYAGAGLNYDFLELATNMI